MHYTTFAQFLIFFLPRFIVEESTLFAQSVSQLQIMASQSWLIWQKIA